MLQSQRHSRAWQCPSSEPQAAALLHGLTQTLQAQPGTPASCSDTSSFLPLPLPWLHESLVYEHRFSAASWWFYPAQVNMRPPTWTKNCQSYISVDTTSRYQKHNSLQPHQRNPAEFDQRNYWKEQEIQASLGVCIHNSRELRHQSTNSEHTQSGLDCVTTFKSKILGSL